MAIGTMYEADHEPAMRYIGRGPSVMLCADVACLAWGGWIGEHAAPALARAAARDRPVKPVLQKRLKNRSDCSGNHLGCSTEAGKGLQCGLSGSRVARPATPCHSAERGTAPSATRGTLWGKPTRT